MRVIGMIPGLTPPKGTVAPPKGFNRLPTGEQLNGMLKEYIKARFPVVDPYIQDMRNDAAMWVDKDAVDNYNRSWGES